MATADVKDMIALLPYAMRESVEGYVDAVDAALIEIAREAHVELTPRLRADFLLIVAIRRIWGAVNGQYWIMNNCAELAGQSGLSGFQARGEVYNKDSHAYLGMRELREQFDLILSENDIRDLVAISSLPDALARMATHE